MALELHRGIPRIGYNQLVTGVAGQSWPDGVTVKRL